MNFDCNASGKAKKAPPATPRPISTATPSPTYAPLPQYEFLGNAVEIARRLGLLAGSGPYYTYCNRSGATQEQWDFVTRGDHTTPARIFALSGETLVAGLTGGNLEAAPFFDLSDVHLRRDLMATLPDMMFQGMDREIVSCCKSLARYKIYAADAPGTCGLLVMLYADATPIVLHWYADAGAVCIVAFFMPDAALEACQTAEDVSAWFAGLRLPVVAFEEVTVQ